MVNVHMGNAITDVVITMGSPNHPAIVISIMDGDGAKVELHKAVTMADIILSEQRMMWMNDEFTNGM